MTNNRNDIDFLLEMAELQKQNKGRIHFHAEDAKGNPGKNLLVTGLLTKDGGQVFTDDSGNAIGYGTAGSKGIGISGYADIIDKITYISIVAGTKMDVSIAFQRRSLTVYASSTNIKFSEACTSVSATLCGGGGGGAGICRTHGTEYSNGSLGGGGGGGFVTSFSFTPSINTSYPLSVGSGGRGGTYAESTSSWSTINGSRGGLTAFLSYSASGGAGGGAVTSSDTAFSGFSIKGGFGNGAGGDGGDGGNGSAGTGGIYDPSYSSSGELRPCGGGGAGGQSTVDGDSKMNRPGTPYGGHGGMAYGTLYEGHYTYNSRNPENGGTPGGGGGGGGYQYSYTTKSAGNGGKGGNGMAGFKMTLKYAI